MDLATATRIVRNDMIATHGSGYPGSPDWTDDAQLYEFICATTNQAVNAYPSYRSNLAEAYIIVHAQAWAEEMARREGVDATTEIVDLASARAYMADVLKRR